MISFRQTNKMTAEGKTMTGGGGHRKLIEQFSPQAYDRKKYGDKNKIKIGRSKISYVFFFNE